MPACKLYLRFLIVSIDNENKKKKHFVFSQQTSSFHKREFHVTPPVSLRWTKKKWHTYHCWYHVHPLWRHCAPLVVMRATSPSQTTNWQNSVCHAFWPARQLASFFFSSFFFEEKASLSAHFGDLRFSAKPLRGVACVTGHCATVDIRGCQTILKAQLCESWQQRISVWSNRHASTWRARVCGQKCIKKLTQNCFFEERVQLSDLQDPSASYSSTFVFLKNSTAHSSGMQNEGDSVLEAGKPETNVLGSLWK